MEIRSKQIADVTIVEFVGELTALTAGPTQESVLKLVEPLPQPGAKVILEMSQLAFMSSAGLRLLLVVTEPLASEAGRSC